MDESCVDEPIELVEYDPRWPALFAEERARVRTALGSAALAIEHFGSTAVPGLAGKPIVDLLVGVDGLDGAELLVAALEVFGYESFGEIFLAGRIYLRRRGPPHFNIALTQIGSPFWTAQIELRDYLRLHPDEAAAYAAHKRAAVAGGARMFSSYSQTKAGFVSALAARAAAWAAGQPAPVQS